MRYGGSCLFYVYEEVAMTGVEQVDVLKSRHAELEQILEDETGRPQPDQSIIAGLKKEKLRIKDELAQLTVQ